MPTGRELHLTKQIGEYLVAAELCRRGMIAATFTGNVPHYDIIASDKAGRVRHVQVKAIRSSSWQMDMGRFMEIAQKGKRQVLGKACPAPVPGLVFVFVKLVGAGKDSFFIVRWEDLRDALVTDYKAYLKKCNGIRPKNPESRHTAFDEKLLESYHNNWKLLTEV